MSKQINIRKTVTSGNTMTFTAEEIRNMFGLDAAVGFTIKKNSANIIYGSTQVGETYPGDNIDIYNTGMPPPCNCVHVQFDRSTQTIILSNC